jgi:ACR3 family arsenite efflux pump ArsB
MVGNWITVTGQLERTPRRFTLAITLGDLPAGWPRSANRARTWSGVVGLVLLAPFVALIAAGFLRSVGITEAYAWISTTTPAILAATISLFVGIPVAIGMNLRRIARIRLRRDAGALEGLVALEFAPLHLAVVLLALLIGAAFVGHLAADSYARWNGLRTAC